MTKFKIAEQGDLGGSRQKPLLQESDRVYVHPYKALGTIVKIEWEEGIKDWLDPGWTYWVKVDGKRTRPQGFCASALSDPADM